MNSDPDVRRSQMLKRQVWFEQIGQSKIATQRRSATDEKGGPRMLTLTKLMALVIRYDQLIRARHVKDRADLSQLAEVSQARVTQLMGLLLLAPDIQEEILALPTTDQRVDPVSERDVRPIVAEPNWEKQRALWNRLVAARFQPANDLEASLPPAWP